MAKREKKATPVRKVKSDSGPTRPTTFRISPGGIADVRRLSDKLDLRSQAGAIETAVAQVLATFARHDARPPLTAEQLALTATAIRAAGVTPRSLGATASYPAIVLAAAMAGESAMVPAHCPAKEYGDLIEVLKSLDPVAALWLIGRALGG